MIYASSAPGSLMLLGEHAVLHDKPALCCAVNQRLRVSLKPRSDDEIQIQSAHLGHCRLDLKNLTVCAPFEFVLSVIHRYHAKIPSGFELTIDSDFSASVGLGSSSAVTVATLGVLDQWLNLALSPLELFTVAKEIIVQVQGVGSGADVAAAVFGGVVAYRRQPLSIQLFPLTPDIVLVYSGAKVPTPTVIHYVSQKQQAQPESYQRLFDSIASCTQAAIVALETQNWPRFGELMNEHHSLQEALGVSTALLNELVSALRHQPQILGAKISGSGLGDCVVGLGSMDNHIFPMNSKQQKVGVKQIPVKISILGHQHE